MQWHLESDTREGVEKDSSEWDEIYAVSDYVQGSGPAWIDFLTDRPELSPGQPHSTVSNVFVQRFEPAIVDGGPLWRVTVKYRSAEVDDDPNINPLLRPAKMTLQPETSDEPTMLWADGTPIVNTAGDLIAGVTKKSNLWVFNFRKNVAAVPSFVLDYGNAVNSDPVSIGGLVFQPGYLHLRQPSADEPERETVAGVEIEYTPFRFAWVYNPKGWRTKVLNMGLYQIFEGRRVPCFDDNHDPVSEPVFLDAAGAQLPLPASPGDLIYKEGWLYDQLPFSIWPTT